MQTLNPSPYLLLFMRPNTAAARAQRRALDAHDTVEHDRDTRPVGGAR